MKTNIICAVKDQFLFKLKSPIITSGDDGVDYIQLKFVDNSWKKLPEGAILKMSFYRDKENIIKMPIENNQCEIPLSVLMDKGTFYFGLFAEHEGKVIKTSQTVSYYVFPGIVTVVQDSENPIRKNDRLVLASALNAAIGEDCSNYTFDELVEIAKTLESTIYGELVKNTIEKLWEFYKEYNPIIPGIDPINPEIIEIETETGDEENG